MELDNKKKKFSLFRLFNPEGNGLGVPKDDLAGPDNLKKCFIIFGRNISNILKLNLLLIFGNFPLFFALYALTGNLNMPTTAASSALFAPLHGAMQFNVNPVNAALFGVHGLQSAISKPTVWTYVVFALAALVIFTFGFVNTGVTHVLRSMVRRQPVSLWSDFWGAIKKNVKQSLIMGIIDSCIIGLLIYDIIFFMVNGSSFMYVNLLILALYTMMRFYIYILLITFDLSIWKIIKNSLIFALLGFKRNILALIGIVVAALLTYTIFVLFVPAGVIIGLFFLFATCMYFGAYAAYPKIKEIMIDPQMNNNEV